MKILFITDLHGNTQKYERLYKAALLCQADVVINGGDMLPKERSLFRQDQFINRQLRRHFELFEKSKINYLCMLGNDDLMIFDPLFEKICEEFTYVKNIAQRKITIKDYAFIGMNWVDDYPFRLKDRCRKDSEKYVFQRQFGSGLLSTTHGWEEIPDWFEYAATLPTIQEELKSLPEPSNMKRSVYIIHMPPADLGLDVCENGEKVGSMAVYNFLRDQQPKYSLHGHIHESPEVSGIWKTKLGTTICIQPGQVGKLTYIIIDSNLNLVERIVE